ncbi:MAG: M14 family metallopeptidase [Candidatus Thiodiazotropha sp.]
MLQEYDELPQGLLSLEADQLAEVLSGPTLFHLRGRKPEPVFFSVLMHGNESVGWEAVRALLSRYAEGKNLPRSVSLFVGNVQAAAQHKRLLPGQRDFNRVWPGGDETDCEEGRVMARVVEIMRERNPFLSVDVHNNTGLNPHYACINRLALPFLHLATLFSRTVVYFLRPRGVQSMAFAELCPSVTLECGKVGSAYGVEHALEYLDACLHLSDHPQHPLTDQDVDLFHTVAQVKVAADARLGFQPDQGDLVFDPDLDHMNFREVPAGTPLGWVNGSGAEVLDVRDEDGRTVLDDYFVCEEGLVCFRKRVMPSMLTKDLDVIHQDCLCYLMERLNISEILV